MIVLMSRRNKRKQKSLALAATGAAAVAPMAIEAAQQYGPKLFKMMQDRWRNNAGPVRRRVRARRAKRAQESNGPDPSLSLAPQITQRENSGAVISNVTGNAMIPRPSVLNNRRGKWMGGTFGPRIAKSEYIGDVLGSTTFASIVFPGQLDSRYALNPGLEPSFPWLSAVAANFESYRFHYLAVHYIPSTNLNAVGNLYMTPVVDATSPQLVASKETLSEQFDTVDTNVKVGATCVFPLGRKTEPYRWRYVRTNVTDTQSLDTRDVGFFQFNRGINADTSIQGELWIEYDVELFNPKFRPSITRVEGGKILSGGTVSAANPFGTAPAVDSSATGINMNGASVLSFANAGYFLVSYRVVGTSPVPNLGPVTNGVLSATFLATSANATDAIINYMFDVSASNSSVTLVASGTVTSAAVYIAAVPGGSLTVPKPTLQEQLDILKSKFDSLQVNPTPQKFVYLGA